MYKPGPPDACWLWTGSLRPNGYGQFRLSTEKNGYAHRAAYELYVGAIPEGMTIDHLCFNPACVNPKHLELVSLGENLRRRRYSDSCKHGHEYTPENTRLDKRGNRICKTCQRLAQEAWKLENHERYLEYHREYKRRQTEARTGRPVTPQKRFRAPDPD